MYINQHPHPNQEVRNEQRITYKLQMIHQRRDMRNKPIHHQPCKESTENTFHPDKFHQSRSQEHHGKHKDELHYIVVIPTEKPTADAGEEIHNQSTQKDNLNDQPHPEQPVRFALEHTSYHSQHQQSQCIRYRRTSHRNAHTTMPGHTIPDNDRICHQRMGRIHTCQQNRSYKTVFQIGHIRHQSNPYRNDECQ